MKTNSPISDPRLDTEHRPIIFPVVEKSDYFHSHFTDKELEAQRNYLPQVTSLEDINDILYVYTI